METEGNAHENQSCIEGQKKLKNGASKVLKSETEYLMAFRHCPLLPFFLQVPVEDCLK